MLLAIFSDHPIHAVMIVILLPAIGVMMMSTLKPEQAAILAAWGAVYFGPVGAGFKLPMLPEVTKQHAPYIGVIVGALIMCPQYITRAKPGSWPGALVFVSMLGSVFTAQTNPDQLVYPGEAVTVILPSLTLKDGFALSMKEFIKVYPAFFVGYAFVRDRQTLRLFARVLMSIQAIYLVLIMYELKMSPQLHEIVWGYGPHNDFLQTRRWGGWRPMVFMAHGLATTIAVLVGNFAVIALARANEPIELFGNHPMTRKWVRNLTWKKLIWGCFVLLVATKSSASIIYGAITMPIAARAKPKIILRTALVIGCLALFYPLGRAYDAIPVDDIVAKIAEVSPERAESMAFRFNNEGLLLRKVQQRPYFGWGEHGRQYFYGYWGESTVPDGYWIIVLGARGLFGFLPAFVLMLYPVFMAQRRWKYVHHESDLLMLSVFTLAISVCVFDFIPNGMYNNYIYFMSGSLCALWYALGDPKKGPPPLAPHEGGTPPGGGYPPQGGGYPPGPYPQQYPPGGYPQYPPAPYPPAQHPPGPYPQQYPPAQYPPAQYPPGQYPPGQYPPQGPGRPG